MTKSLRIAVLTTVLALTAAPVFADPGGTDPPPPPQGKSGASMTMGAAAAAILASFGG